MAMSLLQILIEINMVSLREKSKNEKFIKENLAHYSTRC